MPKSLKSRLTAVIIAHAVLSSALAFAQSAPPQTRPRRVQGQAATPAPVEVGTTRLSAEPVMRIGLITDARAVTISTNGRLLNASAADVMPAPLAASRLRVEARRLAPASPVETETFRVEIASLLTREDAERTAQEVAAMTGAQCSVNYDARAAGWRVCAGTGLPSEAAAELRERLDEAGYAATVWGEQAGQHNPGSQVATNNSTAANQSANNSAYGANSLPTNAGVVRPVASVTAAGATRGLVAFGANAAALINSPAPVTFAAEDEASAPLRLNDKPYRGRLEVIPNRRGTLTVVNVIALEEYVRGVVPNELSPGGYPELEALKAQAVAARTYAMKNRGQFAADGYDLLPTTRSQVYGGLSTEHPLTTRAVEETRGVVATYAGEPINALYTSTCGGRTEDSENIFNKAEAYLRGRECSVEGRAHFSPFTVRTSRELPDIGEEAHATSARDAALLAVNNFDGTPRRLTDTWLSSPLTSNEARGWLTTAARLAGQMPPAITDDATRPPAFSTALVASVFGPQRADTLLDEADINYILTFRDAEEVPPQNRPDVAWLLRDGHLPLYPDATLRPREPLTRARALRAIARLLEARGTLRLQKATVKPATNGAMVLRPTRGRDQLIVVSPDAYLFRQFGEASLPARTLALVGGEAVTFHLNARGEVDFLEARFAPNGAAADRFSPYANWSVRLTPGEVSRRLARWSRGTGALTDLRVAARGSSRRATDLEIVGTNGTAHLRGGRIRSALGLREQLFVIDRETDEAGRTTSFVFTGRGWGHGVGMCQVGAYGLARAGLTYDKILRAYYSDIDLTRLY